MANNFVLFFGGMVAGVGTAVPIGPTNLWLLRAALPPPRRYRNIAAFTIGLIFFDAFYAALGFWGYSTWFARSTYADGAMFVGGIGVTALGILSLWKARHPAEQATLCEAELRNAPAVNANHVLLGDFTMGFFLGSNPSFIAYWIVVVSTAMGYAGGVLTPLNMGAVFCGIVAGDIVWYASLFSCARKFSQAVPPRAILWLQIGIGLAFLVFGGLLVYKSFQ